MRNKLNTTKTSTVRVKTLAVLVFHGKPLKSKAAVMQ